MAVTWVQLRSRVYAITGFDSSRVSSTQIDGWLIQAIIDVSGLIDDRIVDLWDEFSAFEKTSKSQVLADGSISAWPTDAIRVYPSVRVGRATCALLSSKKDIPFDTDEYRQPTREKPVVYLDNSSETPKYYVAPKSFTNQAVVVRYLSKPVITEDTAKTVSVGNQINEAVALKAAAIGSIDMKEKSEAAAFESRLVSYLSDLNGTQK